MAGLHAPVRRPRRLDGRLGSGTPRAKRQWGTHACGEGRGVAGVWDDVDVDVDNRVVGGAARANGCDRRDPVRDLTGADGLLRERHRPTRRGRRCGRCDAAASSGGRQPRRSTARTRCTPGCALEGGWAPPRRKRQWLLFAASVGHRKRGRAGAEPGAVAADAAAADASSARNLRAAAWLRAAVASAAVARAQGRLPALCALWDETVPSTTKTSVATSSISR